MIFKGTGVEVQNEGTKDTGVELTVESTRHLGASIGSPDFKAKFIEKKVRTWSTVVKRIAESQPHAAFSAFARCQQRQWNFYHWTPSSTS